MELKPTKLKVKYESAPQRCEVCHQSDCFNPNTGACSRCGVLVCWQDALAEIVVPASVTVERYDNQLKLIQSWHDKKIIKSLTIPIILSSPAIFLWWLIILTSIIDSASIGEYSSLLTGILFLIFPSFGWLLGPYYLLASYKNQTTISVTNKTLSIKHAPIPWVGNRDISVSNLVQLYVRQGKRVGTIFNPRYLYDLRAKLKNGRDINLVGNLASKEVGHFLKQQVESYLGIVDKLIVGEVAK